MVVGFWLGSPLVVLYVECWRSCRLVRVRFWEGGRQGGQDKDEDGEEDTLGHFEGGR